MNSIQYIVLILAVLLGYPVGKFIAKYTPEELKAGRKWFFSIITACVLGIIFSVFFFKGEDMIFMLSSLVFIILIALASLK